jgi:predicted AlkP superfamily phosphohydrolase/phosphomutase
MRKRYVGTGVALVAALLVCALPAGAYVGPGAGFAVLSSFLALFLAFLYSVFALISWPVRQLLRVFRGRRAYGKARVKRVVIMGFDGMDPELASRLMDEGKLPNFAALRAQGTFQPLETTHPPISPVAWSTFLTGVLPGKHNIYDFLARDPQTYQPFLSSAQIGGPKRALRMGRYTVPLGRRRIKLLRKAKPFWHYLGEAGIFCSVIRVPITFPPEKFSGVLLSGMCVPDLKGSQGTFSLHTTRATAPGVRQSGVVIPFERVNGHLRSYVPGPETQLDPDTPPRELRVPFIMRPDRAGNRAEFDMNGRRFAVSLGEYSDWIAVRFRVAPGATVHGICRMYLKSLEPAVEVYITPVNLHPAKPALPISHPMSYAVYLAKLFGPYATLGLAEDTWALNEHAIGDDAFLEQCYLNHAEREQMFFDALAKTPRGVCVCVWDTTDRVQHMFWRYLERDHPALAGTNGDAARYAGVIEELYRRMDDLVGRTVKQLDNDTLLLVVSDHGFKSFARSFNLNSWLWKNGYLALKEGAGESGEWFHDVDWSRTRAYGLGLNGLYINQQGRERLGTVARGAETESLKRELRAKLRGLADPARGRVAVSEVWDDHSVFPGPYRDNAPDLLLGYNNGYRTGWDSVMGRVNESVWEDNCKAWSGDHCIDARQVPGVLFSNRAIRPEGKASIVDVAATVLDLFGLAKPGHFDGKIWPLLPR